MEVRFTPEELDQISRLAAHRGTDAEGLVKQAALQLIDQDAEYRAAVLSAIEQADRGELIDENEMDLRVERMLKS